MTKNVSGESVFRGIYFMLNLSHQQSRYPLPDEQENEHCQREASGKIMLPEGTPLIVESLEKSVNA